MLKIIHFDKKNNIKQCLFLFILLFHNLKMNGFSNIIRSSIIVLTSMDIIKQKHVIRGNYLKYHFDIFFNFLSPYSIHIIDCGQS